MSSVRWEDEEQKQKVKQRAEAMNMSGISEYIRYLAESDTSGSDLEDDIQRLRNDIEDLQEQRDELEYRYNEIENKIETKKSLIQSKKEKIEERESLSEEVEEKINYLAAMVKAGFNAESNPRVDEIVVESDKFDSVDEVVEEAQDRSEDIDALDYLPQKQLEQQSDVSIDKLRAGDAA